jgi:DNA-directed RNA polymerase subunit RPC12/RpoP
MPHYTCISCSAGFYSAAGQTTLKEDVCSDCGSLLLPVATASESVPAALAPVAVV